MPASGKTTLGINLSKRLSLRFVDTDQLFEKDIKMSISAYWDIHSEFSFRVIERRILLETLLKDPMIIATGGGLPAFMDNMFLLNQYKTIYLKAELDTLKSRVYSKDRPILKFHSLDELLHRRISAYERAKMVHDSNSSIEDLVNNLLK